MLTLEKLPEILNIPPKLYPVITQFNDYKIIVIDGGRGSSKTQTIARLLAYIAELRKIRVFCGREVQNTIEESVYTVFADLVSSYNLAFSVQKSVGLTHLVKGSTFKFKGFREQGSVNIKGVEGADIIWVDEAQTITKPTLDVILPTLRKENVKFIFTLNRYMRDDAVMELTSRADCLHIHIDYFENPFCPLTLKNEAELCKVKSERDYRHIWLGEPLASADDYLFNYEKLHNAFEIEPYGDLFYKQRVMGIDFAAQGNDQCVATVLDRLTNQHWQLTERSAWDEPDTTVSIGKIVHLLGIHKPDIAMLDIGGMGKPVYDRLIELGIKNLYPFDGASTAGVDTTYAANVRADAYLTLMQWFDQGFLKIDRKDAEVVKQLEKIRFKYRSNGSKIIQPKVDMKKELRHSPDDADSLNMAVYGAVKYLGKHANSQTAGNPVTRKYGSKRPR